MPFQAAQIASRVETKALYGCEVLASFWGGHAAAFRSLNDANYAMAKKLLGVPSHVSLGSHVKVFSETRVLTRTGAKAAQRIIMLRARLRCLGPNHLVTEVVQAVARQPHGTWWEHSRQVMLGVGLLREIDEIWEASELRGANEKELKALVAKYKWREVVPAIRRQEETWFRQKPAGLNDDGLVPYRELVPLRQPWSFSLSWARWGRVMWKFFR